MSDKCPTIGGVNTYCRTCGHQLETNPETRVLRWLINKLQSAPDGLTNRDLLLAIAGRDRRHLDAARRYAVQQNLITIDGNRHRIAH